MNCVHSIERAERFNTHKRCETRTSVTGKVTPYNDVILYVHDFKRVTFIPPYVTEQKMTIGLLVLGAYEFIVL